MLYQIKVKLWKVLEKLTGKTILTLNSQGLAAYGERTAVKSKPGFWYAGNIFDTSDIAYGILRNGEVEADGTKLVSYFVKKIISDKGRVTFYDIGANTGYFGILAAYLGQHKATVYAFEPLKEHVMIEQETVLLNNFSNVQIFNNALGSGEGSLELSVAGSGTTARPEFLGSGVYQKRRVPVYSLDDMVEQRRLNPPDFIKIDVESWEYQVLLGAAKTIGGHKPIVWYESALTMPDRNYVNPDFHKLQKFLEEQGYFLYRCAENNFVPAEHDTIPAGVWMYLAVPGQELITKGIYE